MLDKDIREPLFDYLDERYGKVRTFEEKVILKSRADVIAITDSKIIGFEIKSDNDTYTRLKRQIPDYERFCDCCYIVVGQSHIHVEEHVPEHWGIIVVNSENVIVDRDAMPSPRVNLILQLDMLWRNELYNIQLKEGLPKLSNWRRVQIYDRLIKTAGEEKIKQDLVEQLFERDYTIFDNGIRNNNVSGILNKSDIAMRDISGAKKSTSKKYKRKKVSSKRGSDKSRAHVKNYVGKKSKKKKK